MSSLRGAETTLLDSGSTHVVRPDIVKSYGVISVELAVVSRRLPVDRERREIQGKDRILPLGRMIKKLKMKMVWHGDNCELSWHDKTCDEVTVPVTVVGDGPLVPREVGDALMEALAEVEMNEGGHPGLSSFFGAGTGELSSLTSEEQEELYTVLLAALGGDEDVPVRSSSSSASAGPSAPATSGTTSR